MTHKATQSDGRMSMPFLRMGSCLLCMILAMGARAQTDAPTETQPAQDLSEPGQMTVDDLAMQLQLVREQNDVLRKQVDLLERERDALLSQLRFAQQLLVEHNLMDEAIARANQVDTPQRSPSMYENVQPVRNTQQVDNGATEPSDEFDTKAWKDADPFSSPWALRAAVVRSYFEQMSIIPRSTLREQDLFHDAVARWTRTTSRELRSQIEWTVSIERIERDVDGGRRFSGYLRVMDPRTGIGVGPAILVPIPERYAVRALRAPDVSYWELRGEVIAEPRYNPDRAERGIFDEPPIIGPFAEHGWKLMWRNMQPWKAPEETHEER
ncbi:MAG: hypothetical protein H6815_07045 [Phycisphaeraceae bacterium]|nr:hypothetical protein [Phycisphaerales bacterium]MCB9860196.1 hypothetical protein [Phycisphaeraceae bacterium]